MAATAISAYDKAMNIVKTWKGRLPPGQIKQKIEQQCKITQSSASTYYYKCVSELNNTPR